MQIDPKGLEAAIEAAHDAWTNGCEHEADDLGLRHAVPAAITAYLSAVSHEEPAGDTQPVGYVTRYDLEEVAQGRIGGHIYPAGTLRPENEVPLYLRPVAAVSPPDNVAAGPASLNCGEPVAWQHRGPRGGWITTDEKTKWSERALYLHPASQPVPDRGWRPIETAPMDGTRVDLWQKGRFTEAFWDEGEEWWCIDSRYSDGEPCPLAVSPEPTHWMPLPAPPKAGD